jgi:phenylacetate-CoA ligase
MITKYLKHLLKRGQFFKKCLEEITTLEKYSTDELREYQNEKLRDIIKIAYENIPYYQESFKRSRLHYSDIRSVNDLQKLPVINKKTVQENSKDFVNKNYKGFTAKGYTSGTTGNPGVFLRDMRSINYEEAFIVRQIQWAGIKNHIRKASLRGDHLFDSQKNAPPYWKFSALENKLLLSSYHLSDKTLPYYVEKLRKFKPDVLQAYPSTVYVLAQHLEKKNEYLNIPIVQTSSETLYTHWRELIVERLQCKVFDYYGQAERVVFGAECEYHQGLHVAPSYSCFEIIDKHGCGGVTQGRIVGTTLNNMVMPLIRYQTDDLTEILDLKCSCGRNYPSIKPLEMRESNIILTSTGKVISYVLFAVFFRKLKGIKLSQIIQKKDYSFVVKVVKEDNYANATSEEMIKNIQDLMGITVSVKIDFVDDIPRTKNGKFNWIISERNS